MESNFAFRYYDNEELMIKRIDEKLDENERRVRRFLMNYTIDKKESFNLREITDEVSLKVKLEKEEMGVLIDNLSSKLSIVKDERKI